MLGHFQDAHTLCNEERAELRKFKKEALRREAGMQKELNSVEDAATELQKERDDFARREKACGTAERPHAYHNDV
jgi:hypothetical protein